MYIYIYIYIKFNNDNIRNCNLCQIYRRLSLGKGREDPKQVGVVRDTRVPDLVHVAFSTTARVLHAIDNFP